MSAQDSQKGLTAWQVSPQGRYVLGWVQSQCDYMLADVFGFNAVQIGHESIDLLSANRIPLKIKMGDFPAATVLANSTEIPFAAQSVDLIVIPFVLDFDADPHQVLREIERVLRPEGQVLIFGFNPWSLWGGRYWVKQFVGSLLHKSMLFPWNGKYLSIPRLRDWLNLMSFDVAQIEMGCFCPPCHSQKTLSRFSMFELLGRKCWPFAGGVYALRAVKRVRGMRLMSPWATVKKTSTGVLKPGLTGAGASGVAGMQHKGKLE